MKATPIVPGELYRVEFQGITVNVPAANGAAALAAVLEGLV